MRIRKYYVEFAGSNGKTAFVGAGPRGYPLLRSAARLFDTIEEASNAADDIDARYLMKGALPVILDRIVCEVDTIHNLPGLRAHDRGVNGSH